MLQSYHNPEEIQRITEQLKNILIDYYAEPENRPVTNYSNKADTAHQFWMEEPPSSGIGLEAVLQDFKSRVLPQSVKTWHPMFMNQMFAGASLPSIIGDLLSSMMNPTLATWEMSPVATIIERNVAHWMAKLIGMSKGSSGIFLPGGSMSNLLAITVARNTKLGEEIRGQGMYGAQKRTILCSAGCHYSIANAANLLGIGADQVVKVAVNERNEMLIDDFKTQLARCEAEGRPPFMVVSTMGLTVTGGYDPLAEIVEVCRGKDIHLHVDAAWGGGIALTEVGKEVLAGIDAVDTVIWDAHKWLHTPLTCTVLLAKDPEVLRRTFASNADYLFHPQSEDLAHAEDLGHYTLLCGKRFDALKVWMLFQTLGVDTFKEMAEDRRRFGIHINAMISEMADFETAYTPISPIVCWRYLPKSVEGASEKYVDDLQRYIRERAKMEGSALFNITKLHGRDWFRAILVNPLTTEKHVIDMLARLRELGQDYIKENPPK